MISNIIKLHVALTLPMGAGFIYRKWRNSYIDKAIKYVEEKEYSKYDLLDMYPGRERRTWTFFISKSNGIEVIEDYVQKLEILKSDTGCNYVKVKEVHEGEKIGKRELNPGMYHIRAYLTEDFMRATLRVE